MYTVTEGFYDKVLRVWLWRGDSYPPPGRVVSDGRLAELATSGNDMCRPMIAAIEAPPLPPVGPEGRVGPIEAPEDSIRPETAVPKRRAARKK